MALIGLIHDYLLWHYSVAYIDMYGICRNYLFAVSNMFSVPDLFLTLFAPFKRLEEEKVNVLRAPEIFFGNIFINFVMRIVGFVLRTALIVIALVAFLSVIAVFLATLFLWTILPALVVYFFMSGLNYLSP